METKVIYAEKENEKYKTFVTNFNNELIKCREELKQLNKMIDETKNKNILLQEKNKLLEEKIAELKSNIRYRLTL